MIWISSWESSGKGGGGGGGGLAAPCATTTGLGAMDWLLPVPPHSLTNLYVHFRFLCYIYLLAFTC